MCYTGENERSEITSHDKSYGRNRAIPDVYVTIENIIIRGFSSDLVGRCRRRRDAANPSSSRRAELRACEPTGACAVARAFWSTAKQPDKDNANHNNRNTSTIDHGKHGLPVPRAQRTAVNGRPVPRARRGRGRCPWDGGDGYLCSDPGTTAVVVDSCGARKTGVAKRVWSYVVEVTTTLFRDLEFSLDARAPLSAIIFLLFCLRLFTPIVELISPVALVR